MSILNRWLEYLDRNRVRYSHSIHAPAQTALGRPTPSASHPMIWPSRLSIVATPGSAFAVVAADERLDLLEIARLRGISHIGLATEETLDERFPDYGVGAAPPFGEPYNVPVLLDSGIASKEFIAFPIGTHRDVVRISLADYKRLVKPMIAPITVNQTALA